jgi:hypothetical protein
MTSCAPNRRICSCFAGDETDGTKLLRRERHCYTMVAAGCGDHTDRGYLASQKMGKGAPRLEGAAMLKKLELQGQHVGWQAEVRRIHLDYRRVPDVRPDELVGVLYPSGARLTREELFDHGSSISTAGS